MPIAADLEQHRVALAGHCLVKKALANGGNPAMEAMDHGFMYGHSFYDPDGHPWEVMWMDPKALEQK